LGLGDTAPLLGARTIPFSRSGSDSRPPDSLDRNLPSEQKTLTATRLNADAVVRVLEGADGPGSAARRALSDYRVARNIDA
jgi:hypothetical protein